MYNHNSLSDFRTYRTEQHVSLEKHQQMIQNTLRWQQTSRSIDEQSNIVMIHLQRIFYFLRDLVVSAIKPKRKRKYKQYTPCTEVEYADCG